MLLACGSLAARLQRSSVLALLLPLLRSIDRSVDRDRNPLHLSCRWRWLGLEIDRGGGPVVEPGLNRLGASNEGSADCSCGGSLAIDPSSNPKHTCTHACWAGLTRPIAHTHLQAASMRREVWSSSSRRAAVAAALLLVVLVLLPWCVPLTWLAGWDDRGVESCVCVPSCVCVCLDRKPDERPTTTTTNLSHAC